jgi:hypothetical protein
VYPFFFEGITLWNRIFCGLGIYTPFHLERLRIHFPIAYYFLLRQFSDRIGGQNNPRLMLYFFCARTK